MASVGESPRTALAIAPAASPSMDAEAEAEVATLLARLEALEGSPRKPTWAWLIVVLGLVLALGGAAHGSGPYATIHTIDQRSAVETLNPGALFAEVATTGPRVGNAVDNASRPAYARALEQYVLDGTVCGLGITLVLAGLFVRLNR